MNDPNLGRPGWRTTEFWLAALTNVLAVLVVIWPHTFNRVGPDQVRAVALAIAGGVNSAYAIARAIVKHGWFKAIASGNVVKVITTPAPAPPAPAPVIPDTPPPNTSPNPAGTTSRRGPGRPRKS